ncbi:ABC transporter ATP-binding protein [Parafrankia sp. EUN1f]|uniref:ABC transporter ATP-binding protein n=1 Tax=Parafrankia sp. EUN1f TaxID=102897 RepID=UPI0001C46FBD|nr:ATP-binding cassette domain-containing protein [Parafrankia sp. EUN1f]EFC86752.1 ABC transporter related protein [Parafrankia sp. EUN1f]
MVSAAAPGTYAPSAQTVLEARDLTTGYGELAAVRGVDLQVRAGEIVALLGPNGAGKTTTLAALAGALPALGGEVRLLGKPVTGPVHARVRSGLGYLPSDRAIVNRLTVAENLKLGRGRPDEAVDRFPALEALLRRPAGLLSGGEQQMLVLARCLVARPQVVLVDELSQGLAPIVVQDLLASLRREAKATGVAVLLVEQQVRRALSVADRWYLLRQGTVADSGDADEASAQRLVTTYL